MAQDPDISSGLGEPAGRVRSRPAQAEGCSNAVPLSPRGLVLPDSTAPGQTITNRRSTQVLNENEEDRPAQTATDHDGASLGDLKPRLLIVDDQEQIVTALQRELRNEAYVIDAFTNSCTAAEAIEREEYALVISDNIMPELGGLELLAKAKASHPETRRILLTGHTELADAVRAFNDGTIHRYVHKPWNSAELRSMVREEVDRHQQHHAVEENLESLKRKTMQQINELLRAKIKLKQAETAIALHEDMANLAPVVVPPHLLKLSYLIVDGDAGVRRLLADGFRKIGLSRCSVVADGLEAEAYFKVHGRVDVVISELQLEGINGIQFHRMLREHDQLSRNGVFILMTTPAYLNYVKVALEAGVNGHVLKPFHLSTLLEQIECLLPSGGAERFKHGIKELSPLSFVVANPSSAARFQIKHHLVSSGMDNVAVAASGPGALHMVRHRKADVLIYDSALTDPGWKDIRAALAREQPALHPTLVFTSMAAGQKELDEATRLGVTNFITGPFTQGELLTSILMALSANRAQAATSAPPPSAERTGGDTGP
ncbi:MAG: response regulator [Candidatus Lambdaproteobacteria bacterium]|nr:response regulator [Candidatus Lambdaproteobacteria bacterium]